MADSALRARAAWDGAPPDWVVVLAEECDARGSQKLAAAAVGMSASVINQVIGNTYKGDVGGVEERVRGAFMAKTVDCPGYGQAIGRDLCLVEQKRPFNGANPTRARLWRACRGGCPHSRIGKETRR